MLDDIDVKIIGLLQVSGRMSFTELARVTGLSVSAAHQRVRRLEQRGVIRGYSAIIDAAAVGLELTAFVAMIPGDATAVDAVPGQLLDVPEVEACHSVAGMESYLLKVRTRSPGALEALLAELRRRCGMTTRTTVVLSTPFEGRPCMATSRPTPDPAYAPDPGQVGGQP